LPAQAPSFVFAPLRPRRGFNGNILNQNKPPNKPKRRNASIKRKPVSIADLLISALSSAVPFSDEHR
jgi:hypothetical protein